MHLIRLHFFEAGLAVALDGRDEGGEQTCRLLGLAEGTDRIFHSGMDGLGDIEVLFTASASVFVEWHVSPPCDDHKGRMRP